MLLKEYYNVLCNGHIPNFLNKYLLCPSLLRLKEVSYFCGMDYASKDVYNFSEIITRYDHSLTTALLTYKLTRNKEYTIAALFHDISTPCFSHAIDYMNKDYANQESTEDFTEQIILNDTYLLKCLLEDGIDVNRIINYKDLSVVDNKRPKLCADRLDGIILTSIAWTKKINKEDIKNIINDISLNINENYEDEISFKNDNIAKLVLFLSDIINEYCHSKEDNYMMELLAIITKKGINLGCYKYEDLYRFNEKELFSILNKTNNIELLELLNKFYTIKKDDIEEIDLPYIKARTINPLVNTKRLI